MPFKLTIRFVRDRVRFWLKFIFFERCSWYEHSQANDYPVLSRKQLF
jgi:hypothetical protein